MNKVEITEQDLKDDFILFVHYIWKLLNLPPPTPVQVRIAEWISNRSNRDRGVLAYRGAGKSYLYYVYCVHRIWNDPNIKILVLSATSARADAFSKTVKQMMELAPPLRCLIPPKGSLNEWSNISWTVHGAEVSGSPTVRSVGITSQITGMRADICLLDDVSSPANSMTVDQREKLRERVAEMEDIRKGDETGTGVGATSEVLYAGTPQSYESLYYHLATLGVKFRVYPARYPLVDNVRSYNGMLDPSMENELYENTGLEGRPTDPKRFTDQELITREIKQGKARFQLQFMLNPELSDADKFPLKLSDLIIYTPSKYSAPRQVSHSLDPKLEIKELRNVGFSTDRFRRPSYKDDTQLPYERIIMGLDPSGRGSDETGWCVIGTLMGTMYLLDAGAFTGGYEENSVLIPIARKCKEWDVHTFVSESNMGDGMFNNLLRPVMLKYHKCTLDEVRNNIRKEQRIIDTLEPLMMRHKLVVSESVIVDDLRDAEKIGKDGSDHKRLAYSLFYQMTHISHEKDCLIHDDRLDALAIGVGYLVDSVDRDSDMEIQQRKDQDYRDIMERKGRVSINNKEHDRGGQPYVNTEYDRSVGQGGFYSLLDG